MNKYQEALDYFWKFYNENAIEGSMLFRHYLDEIKELVDKETQIKPIPFLNSLFKCENCKGIFQNYHYQNRCPNCGQKLDWSDINE